MRIRRHSSRYVRYHPGIINTLKNRFYAKVLLPDDSGCMLWTGGKTQSGYGLFHINNKMHRAHCVSYAMHFGEIQNGLEVMHSCDNPLCVAPFHLSVGTHH